MLIFQIDPEGILRQLPNWLGEGLLKSMIVLTFGGLLLALGFRTWTQRQFTKGLAWLTARFCPGDKTVARVRKAVERVPGSGGKIEAEGLWTGRKPHMPTGYGKAVVRAKILAVGNLKGGVGKTTLAANTAVALARDLDAKILLIDLDFQGSLSSMAVEGTDWQPAAGQNSHATRLVSRDLTARDIVSAYHKPARGESRVHVVPAWYDLGVADNRLLIEWLLADPGSESEDRRYWLAETLHDPLIAKTYAAVIIDCPPRLTAGHVQALCAASHVVVPTIMDRASSEAVVTYAQEIERLRATICPHLRPLGVVGTKWQSYASQKRALGGLRTLLGRLGGTWPLAPEGAILPLRTVLGEEGLGLDDLKPNDEARNAIRAIAVWIKQEMHLDDPR